MKAVLCIFTALFLLAACEQSKEAGDKAARELTGSNMIKQKNDIQKQLQGIERQQKQRLEQLDE